MSAINTCPARVAHFGRGKSANRGTYERAIKAVTYRSDRSEGPTAGTATAGTATVAPLEFLARVLVHIPEKGHVTTRYHGWDANRPRGMRERQRPPQRTDRPP